MQSPVGSHAPQLDRDAVGRDILANVIEEDFGPAAAVEDDTRRGDEEVADPRPALRGRQQQRGDQRGRAARRNKDMDENSLVRGGAFVQSG